MGKDILRQLAGAVVSGAPVQNIQRAAAHRFGLPARVITSRENAHPAPRARQVAMFVAHSLLKKGPCELGRRFKRDHSTVSHGIRRIAEMVATDERLRADVDAVIDAVRG